MKILELISPELKVGTIPDEIPIPSDMELRHAPGGAYAKVSNDPESLHGVVKSLHTPTRFSDDAYFQYVKAIKPYMGENPFLPRIYLVNITKDSKGNMVPDYHMEKLLELGDLNIRELLSINDSFGLDTPEYVDKYSVAKNVISHILEMVETPSKVENDQLRQALEIIKGVKESNRKFRYDMHAGNFMARRTSVGVQLVFTDPLADGGHSQVGHPAWGSTEKNVSDPRIPDFE